MNRLSLALSILMMSGINLPEQLFAVDVPPIVDGIEGQPLAANAARLVRALEFLGAPLPSATAADIAKAVDEQDSTKVQTTLDKHVMFVVTINPESRVKVVRGPAAPVLQQAGWKPVLVKVVNESTVTTPLQVGSPQSGRVYGGEGSLVSGFWRNAALENSKTTARFLGIQMFHEPPMTRDLSGLGVEYAIALIYSSDAGKREASIHFDVDQGTQDLGFRGETAVLFDVKPAIPVKLSITDFDGKPTVARLTFTDDAGHVYPPQSKRLAPDFFFQQQIYREDRSVVLLPPGKFTVEYGRGPEYLMKSRTVEIDARSTDLAIRLERWVHPAAYGWYNGDHHIHAAGCSHYTHPSEGVKPEDMFLHVKGEGMNVGCCLTWGPCYEFQRQFFEAKPHPISDPFTVIKYDVEVSGFGSQALGHVCLLNLRDQTFPGSEGTKSKGWPTWTTPLMKWGKLQGAVTGYAHSANGLRVNVKNASTRLLAELDADQDGFVSAGEATLGRWPLPESFAAIDKDGDGRLSGDELLRSHERAILTLPNLTIPEMNGIGAQEICVSTAMGVCDFISAMDTTRLPEWKCWYHIMNCGFPLKVSGETDFPCVSGSRVGQGRVYVQLGKIDAIDYAAWCDGIKSGRSYVSDGYAHALEFQVNDKSPGFEDVAIDGPGNVKVKAKVVFAKDLALGTAPGGDAPTGDQRLVELILNGQVAASQTVPADDRIHDVTFDLKIDQSSWVALRHFPQMHTNPVNVIVAGRPIRASRKSAKWCVGVIEQLWKVRGAGIAETERDAAETTFKSALQMYQKIMEECPEGS